MNAKTDLTFRQKYYTEKLKNELTMIKTVQKWIEYKQILFLIS